MIRRLGAALAGLLMAGSVLAPVRADFRPVWEGTVPGTQVQTLLFHDSVGTGFPLRGAATDAGLVTFDTQGHPTLVRALGEEERVWLDSETGRYAVTRPAATGTQVLTGVLEPAAAERRERPRCTVPGTVDRVQFLPAGGFAVLEQGRRRCRFYRADGTLVGAYPLPGTGPVEARSAGGAGGLILRVRNPEPEGGAGNFLACLNPQGRPQFEVRPPGGPARVAGSAAGVVAVLAGSALTLFESDGTIRWTQELPSGTAEVQLTPDGTRCAVLLPRHGRLALLEAASGTLEASWDIPPPRAREVPRLLAVESRRVLLTYPRREGEGTQVIRIFAQETTGRTQGVIEQSGTDPQPHWHAETATLALLDAGTVTLYQLSEMERTNAQKVEDAS